MLSGHRRRSISAAPVLSKRSFFLLRFMQKRMQKPSITVTSAEGAVATVSIGLDGVVRVDLRCGQVLDAIVLRSYAIGAVHMALGWVTSEGLSVDEEGTISDLTIRSFGVLRSADMPHVEVTLHEEDSEPVNGSDAVFAATAAAVWSAQGWPTDWPTGRSMTDPVRVTQ